MQYTYKCYHFMSTSTTKSFKKSSIGIKWLADLTTNCKLPISLYFSVFKTNNSKYTIQTSVFSIILFLVTDTKVKHN